MTATDAKRLLDRYFAGETSLEEERQLGDYLRGDNLPPDLAPYRPLFAYWAQQGDQRSPVRPIRRRLRRGWAGVAATVALLLAAATWWLPSPEREQLTDFPVEARQPVDWSRYEVTDQEEALTLIGGALRRASDGLNTSRRLTVDELRRTTDIINPN